MTANSLLRTEFVRYQAEGAETLSRPPHGYNLGALIYNYLVDEYKDFFAAHEKAVTFQVVRQQRRYIAKHLQSTGSKTPPDKQKIINLAIKTELIKILFAELTENTSKTPSNLRF